MRALLIVLAFVAGSAASLLQRGPVELAGYRVSLRSAMPTLTSLAAAQPPDVVPSSAYRYDAPPSISRATYEAVFCDAGSAACSEAGAMYDLLVGYGLDPAVEAGQAWHETVLGTAGVGVPAIKNLHGVQCHAGDNRVGDSPVLWGNGCAGIYASYLASVDTWARLIQREYLSEGRNTPELVVAKYAPANADGNNPPAYIAKMKDYIDQMRARDQQQTTVAVAFLPTAPAPVIGDQRAPSGNPICVTGHVAVSQGYDGGSHQPTATMGGLDLAIVNADGFFDPGLTNGAPVCATHAGAVEAVGDSWPGGNCIVLNGDGYMTKYCHLSGFAVPGGTEVQRGDLIGYVGSTGLSSGPHLHYETWEGGANRNPCDFGAPC